MEYRNAHCPYCKAADNIVEANIAGHFVACQSCGARGPLKDSPAEARAAWNFDDVSQSQSAGDLQVIGYVSTEAIEALQCDAEVSVTCFNKAQSVLTGAVAVVRYDLALSLIELAQSGQSPLALDSESVAPISPHV